MPLWVSRKDSRVGKFVAMMGMGRPAWTKHNYKDLATEGYILNVIGYRCVRMIAEAAASIPWLVYEGDKELSEHPFLKLLNGPNRMQGGPEFWDEFYSYLQLSGNGYIEGVELDGDIRELYNLRPDRMKVIPGARGWPIGYEFSVNGKTYTFVIEYGRQSPIMHQKLFSPLDDHYGMSPIIAGAKPIDTHNSSADFNKALLDNVARPSGALQTDKDLSEEQFRRLKNDLDTQYTGKSNAGKPLLLEGGLKWQAMSLTPMELDFVNGKRDAARDVALAYGVPPMILGIPGDNTFSNYAEAHRAFYRQAVLPLVDRTCGRLTMWGRPTYGDKFRVAYDPDNIEALAPERKELWDRLRFAQFLEVDEKRVAAGYEPLPNGRGKVVVISSNSADLDDLHELAVPPTPPVDPNKPAAKPPTKL